MMEGGAYTSLDMLDMVLGRTSGLQRSFLSTSSTIIAHIDPINYVDLHASPGCLLVSDVKLLFEDWTVLNACIQTRQMQLAR